VLAAVDSLAEDPRPDSAFPLGMTGMLHLRAGKYRVVYQIDETTRTASVMHVGRGA
jgi:mRNA-degrading endonuclease RelE of RelBE toxin-antitoxin system